MLSLWLMVELLGLSFRIVMTCLNTILEQLLMEEVQNKANGILIRLVKNLTSIQFIDLAVVQKICFDDLQIHDLITLLCSFSLA